MSHGTLLLDKNQMLQKIRRMAFEIYERNHEEKVIVFAGIFEKGYRFAELLLREFESISPLKTELVRIDLDKRSLLQTEITLDCSIESLQNKTVILVDDVLSTGRTLAYSLKPFLNIEIKKLQTAVVVDREHSLFPISSSYTGYSLSTTLQEHIHVELFNESEMGVYLR